MKPYLTALLLLITLFMVSACNSIDRFSILKKCTVLGDESIVYARAHYVKLFHHYNPNKFYDSYQKITDFDATTHRNTIDTYERAVDKVNSDEQITENLLSSCKNLAEFSRNFVDQSYPLAIKHSSNKNPLSDAFFIEINLIVRFDDKIGLFDKSKTSFKQNVNAYQKAVTEYIEHYRKYIPSEFVNQRLKS